MAEMVKETMKMTLIEKVKAAVAKATKGPWDYTIDGAGDRLDPTRR
jgi:hypothetical protein